MASRYDDELWEPSARARVDPAPRFRDPAVIARVSAAVADFGRASPGRSVILESIRGPELTASFRPDEVRPGASLLKLPLVAAIYRAADASDLRLDRQVRRRELGSTRFRSVLAGFSRDHAFRLDELCALCLITSDNPIAEYLLSLVGVSEVNREAHRLGAPATRLEVGFADAELGAEGRRNVTTARDALTLVRALSTRTRFSALATALANGMLNSRLPVQLPADTRVAHKTGTLPGAANDAGVIFGQGIDLAIAVLSDGVADTPAESLAIGYCMAAIWDAVGEL
jgi:beta-lactamase class A